MSALAACDNTFGDVMNAQRTQVELPDDLIQQIDALVGSEGRSAFVVQTTQAELRRRRLVAFLESDEGFDPAAHPEWDDAAAWVRELRREGDREFQERIPLAKEAS